MASVGDTVYMVDERNLSVVPLVLRNQEAVAAFATMPSTIRAETRHEATTKAVVLLDDRVKALTQEIASLKAQKRFLQSYF